MCRRNGQFIEKSSDGLFRYHHRVVIPRPLLALIKALLVEYHDKAGHPNYPNRAKPDRREGAALQPLRIPEYPWEIVGIDYVTDLPQSGIDGYPSVFIMICHLAKMAHFVPCHKEITTEESTTLFIHHCY